MASRHEDWFRQAQRDIEQAKASREDGFYEWACFAAQQSSEKALKAVFQRYGGEAWGHSLADLVQALPKEAQPPPDLIDLARELDRHYVAPRYPNTVPSGAPGDSYTRAEADKAIENAERILRFCQSHILREGEGLEGAEGAGG